MKKGYMYLIITATSYASMGALVKILSNDFQPFTQLFLRLLFAGVLSLGVVLFSKKKIWLQHVSDYFWVAFMGIVGYGICLGLYTAAFNYSSIGSVLFLFSSYPIFSALLAAFFLKETINQRMKLAIVILSLALLLLFNPTNITQETTGSIFALIAGFCFAIYVVCSRYLSKRGNQPESLMLWSVFWAIITAGIGAFLFESHAHLIFTHQSIIILGLFGILNFVGWSFVNKGFEHVNASVGTMILLLEPVLGALIGLLFFKEIPNLIFIVGAIELILAIYVASFRLE